MIVNYQKYHKQQIWFKNKNNIDVCVNLASEILSNDSLICKKSRKDVKDLILKIKNYIDRWSLDESLNDILKKISMDRLVASQFAKSAVTQNISEETQLKWLNEVKSLNVEKLPSSGEKAWRFIKGTGKFIQTNKIEDKTSHSCDFKCKLPTWNDWIFAKVTTTQGGGQNHQRVEMINILTDMKLFIDTNPNSNDRFVLLLDGDNYGGMGIDVFKKYETPRILITNSDEYGNK
jgi:hypothetical protein